MGEGPAAVRVRHSKARHYAAVAAATVMAAGLAVGATATGANAVPKAVPDGWYDHQPRVIVNGSNTAADQPICSSAPILHPAAPASGHPRPGHRRGRQEITHRAASGGDRTPVAAAVSRRWTWRAGWESQDGGHVP